MLRNHHRKEVNHGQSFVVRDVDILGPDGLIRNASLTCRSGIIEKIDHMSYTSQAKTISAPGLTLLPGLIDLHSDAIETAIQPRPGARFPIPLALRELDKSIVGCGITTMFHCISFSDGQEDSLRFHTMSAALAKEINLQAPDLRAKTRVHLRFEMTEKENAALIEKLIREGQINFFSIMDHTPGQGQFVELDTFRSYYGKVRGKSPAELDALIEARIRMRRELDESIIHFLCNLCREQKIRIASHDDDSRKKVAWNEKFGVSVAEFPVKMEAAAEAAKRNMHVSFGSPNVLRGKSATGNLDAREAIRSGAGNIICSDYAPMSLFHAAMTLVREEIKSLGEAVKMVTLNPAMAAGISDQTGSIEEGKQADFILVDLQNPIPRVVRTFVEGREVYCSN